MLDPITNLGVSADATAALDSIFRSDMCASEHVLADHYLTSAYVFLPPSGGGIPSWVVPTVTFLTALAVALTNFFIQRWRSKIDRLAAAVDQLASEIDSGADLALSFWLLDCTQTEQRKQAKALEPALIGRQSRIRNLFLALQEQDLRLRLNDVEASIDDLFDWMTGHTFGDSDRTADLEAGRMTQTIAPILHGRLRAALNQRTRKIF